MAELEARLAGEVEVFARYLASIPASEYVRRRYVEAHRSSPERFAVWEVERPLLNWAARGGLCTRMADVYARFRAPHGSLRKKLVLTLALIESTDAGTAAVDRVSHANAGSRLAFLVAAAARGTLSVACLALGLVVFGWRPLTPDDKKTRPEGAA